MKKGFKIRQSIEERCQDKTSIEERFQEKTSIEERFQDKTSIEERFQDKIYGLQTLNPEKCKEIG